MIYKGLALSFVLKLLLYVMFSDVLHIQIFGKLPEENGICYRVKVCCILMLECSSLSLICCPILLPWFLTVQNILLPWYMMLGQSLLQSDTKFSPLSLISCPILLP